MCKKKINVGVDYAGSLPDYSVTIIKKSDGTKYHHIEIEYNPYVPHEKKVGCK